MTLTHAHNTNTQIIKLAAERAQSIQDIVYGKLIIGTREHGVVLDLDTNEYFVRHDNDWFGGSYASERAAGAVLNTLPTPTPPTPVYCPRCGSKAHPFTETNPRLMCLDCLIFIDEMQNPQPKPITQPKAEKAKCPHHACIRRFHAVAKSMGLDTKARDAIRVATQNYFGRTIVSREELTGDQWLCLAKAVEQGELAW